MPILRQSKILWFNRTSKFRVQESSTVVTSRITSHWYSRLLLFSKYIVGILVICHKEKCTLVSEYTNEFLVASTTGCDYCCRLVVDNAVGINSYGVGTNTLSTQLRGIVSVYTVDIFPAIFFNRRCIREEEKFINNYICKEFYMSVFFRV